MSASSADKSITSSLGPLQSLPTFVSNTNLSTTPVKITLPTDSSGSKVHRIKITNGSSANTISYTLVTKDAAAPSITADYAASTCGCVILPAQCESIAIPTYRDLYLVASAASTSYNVTIFCE